MLPPSHSLLWMPPAGIASTSHAGKSQASTRRPSLVKMLDSPSALITRSPCMTHRPRYGCWAREADRRRRRRRRRHRYNPTLRSAALQAAASPSPAWEGAFRQSDSTLSQRRRLVLQRTHFGGRKRLTSAAGAKICSLLSAPSIFPPLLVSHYCFPARTNEPHLVGRDKDHAAPGGVAAVCVHCPTAAAAAGVGIGCEP